jgi:hypothetical protein
MTGHSIVIADCCSSILHSTSLQYHVSGTISGHRHRMSCGMLSQADGVGSTILERSSLCLQKIFFLSRVFKVMTVLKVVNLSHTHMCYLCYQATQRHRTYSIHSTPTTTAAKQKTLAVHNDNNIAQCTFCCDSSDSVNDNDNGNNDYNDLSDIILVELHQVPSSTQRRHTPQSHDRVSSQSSRTDYDCSTISFHSKHQPSSATLSATITIVPQKRKTI